MIELFSRCERPASYRVSEGATAIVADMYAQTPAEADVARERRIESWGSTVFRYGNAFHFFGFAEGERRQPSPLEIVRLELIANMCEAAAS